MMKKCLFFFLALVITITIALVSESTVVDRLNDQTASNYIPEDKEENGVPQEDIALDHMDTRKGNSKEHDNR